MTQVTNFIFLTEKMVEMPIAVRAAKSGDDTESYAYQIRSLPNAAGYNPPVKVDEWGITRDKVAPIVARQIGNNEEWNDVYLNSGSNSPKRFPDFYFEATNGLIRPIIPDGSPATIHYAIVFCFRQIGIKAGWHPDVEWVKPGEFEFFIPPMNL